jgi:methylated-DNA-[protein]-cysteine S-methyltransferase
MTEFREKVYNIVKKIPKGKTMTYKEVAEAVGHSGAYRAVGSVLNKNRLKSVPCHRVIKSNGLVGGYTRGTEAKRKMLRKEGWQQG